MEAEISKMLELLQKNQQKIELLSGKLLDMIPEKPSRFSEIVADIAYTAGEVRSGVTRREIIAWAREFEAANADKNLTDEAYERMVTDFALSKIRDANGLAPLDAAVGKLMEMDQLGD